VAGETHQSQIVTDVACAVLTISDTRTTDTDTSGRCVCDALTSGGHRVTAYEIVPDDPPYIRRCLERFVADPACRAVVMSGGTGLARRDTTTDVVESMLDKRLEGFGELFRSLSYGEIGAAAMLSRATAGSAGSTVIFSLPGSPAAVRLGMEKLILPELGHIAYLLQQ